MQEKIRFDLVDYSSLIDAMREIADETKGKLIRDFNFLKSEREKNLHLFCLSIQHYYKRLALFPDEEIMGKFRQLNFFEAYLKWFIPLKEIEDQFEHIKKAGFEIKQLDALFYIGLHIQIKIEAELNLMANGKKIYNKNEEANQLFIDISNVIRKKKGKDENFAKGKRLRSDRDTDYIALLKHEYLFMLKHNETDFVNNTILDLTRGLTEKTFLKEMVHKCFQNPKKISQRKFYIAIYELVRILLPDNLYDLPTENEFYQNPLYSKDRIIKVKDANGKSFTEFRPPSHDNFENLQVDRMKNLFFRRTATKSRKAQ